ncbi:MAG: GUN4 domain-containing protein [Heteroscytonema crispum UTEX LB 1556]
MSPVGVRTSQSTHVLETGLAKLWLLLVGVNQYQDEALPSLGYPALDCQGLAEALLAATEGFPQREILIHHDFAFYQSNLDTVRSSLRQIVKASKSIDTILFYFSGHGMLESNTQQVVLCLKDTQKDNLINTGLKLQELLQLLENCQAQQQLVCLDACHSGGMTLLGAKGTTQTEPILNPTTQLVEVLRQRAAKRKGFYALLSCDQGQQSWEFPQLGHGVFTYYLIRGLRGEASDSQGVIEADGLYRYVYHQTLAYIDKFNQQLRLINQQKRGRGETQIYSEYPLQTPKRIVEGVGELILGLKPKGLESRHLRQALVIDGLAQNENSLALSKILEGAGGFDVEYWSYFDNSATSDIRKIIQKCLLSECFAQKPTRSIVPKETATVLLYMRSRIQQTEQQESVLLLGEDVTITRSWLKKQLRRSKSQQIIVLDCPVKSDTQSLSLRDWVEELQLGIDEGQCLIAAASPLEELDKFATVAIETLSKTTQASGLTAAGWITQLQVELADSKIKLYILLSGSQGVIEVLQGSVEASTVKNSTPDNLTSSVGIDYRKLRDLLKAKKWRDADEETTNLMLKLAHQEQQNHLESERIQNIPETDLKTIDTLWVKYSNGRFGFSVQKGIWQSLRSSKAADYVLALAIGNDNVANSETCIDFVNRVGWRLKDSWIEYSDLNFSDDAPPGHLPFFGFFEKVWRVKVLGVWEWHSAIVTASWWRLCVALLSRFESFNIKA